MYWTRSHVLQCLFLIPQRESMLMQRPTGEASNLETLATRASSSTTTAAVMNPLYEAWVTTDQLLLGWLYNSMTS